MKKRLKQLFVGALSAVMLLPGIGCMQSYALTFTREGNVLKSDGTLYFPNTMGGAKAYLPIELSKANGNKKAIANGMLKLPGMQDGSGGKANTAAFRYQGFNSYIGAKAQYWVKTASTLITASGTRWEVPSISVSEKNRLSFRYAGMVITGSDRNSLDPSKSKTVIAGTNPYFPVDTIQPTSSSGDGRDTAIVFEEQHNDDGSVSYIGRDTTVYGTGGGVVDFDDVFTNGYNGTSYEKAQGNIKIGRAHV